MIAGFFPADVRGHHGAARERPRPIREGRARTTLPPVMTCASSNSDFRADNDKPAERLADFWTRSRPPGGGELHVGTVLVKGRGMHKAPGGAETGGLDLRFE